MTHYWRSLVTLAICLLGASVQLYWGGEDKQGVFHAENLWANGNVGICLFFVGPYSLFAATALIAWRNRASLVSLALAAVLSGVGIAAAWADHTQYLNTPPGRETQPILNFLATILLWIGSFIALVAVGFMRIGSRKQTVA